MRQRPAPGSGPGLDLSELRAAIAAADALCFLAAVTGHHIDDALQQVRGGIPMALEPSRRDAEPVALSVINRLTWRGGAGDQVLAREPAVLPARRTADRQGGAGRSGTCSAQCWKAIPTCQPGGYLELRTGQM